MKKLLATILLLTSAPVLAHTGHLTNESVHGFLHIEHIIVIAAIALLVYFIKRSKL